MICCARSSAEKEVLNKYSPDSFKLDQDQLQRLMEQAQAYMQRLQQFMEQLMQRFPQHSEQMGERMEELSIKSINSSKNVFATA